MNDINIVDELKDLLNEYINIMFSPMLTASPNSDEILNTMEVRSNGLV